MGTARYLTVRRLANRRALRPPLRQQGAIAIMTSVVLIAIIGFCGLALDLALLYNRKIEMQSVADLVALSAAAELNGTTDGITKAVAQVSARLSPLGTAGGLSYQYSTRSMEDWSNAGIEFSSAPSGAEWLDATSASGRPLRMRYVKVDTSKLNTAYGEISTLFMHILAPSTAVVSTSARAIAGPSSIKVTPLAVCAMRPLEPAHDRSGELVEYGFRRGVGYDLMDLNPDATTAPGKSFVINPSAAPGVIGSLPSTDLSKVKPFVCTGTMAMRSVIGGTLTVESPFPLGQLFTQLNSRFDIPGAPCNQYSAPPDANIKPYVFNNNGVLPLNASVPWMNVAPSGQTAALSTVDGKRWTIADPESMPSTPVITGVMYGPLWSYAKAAKYAASEPPGGYSTFATTDWGTLYNPGQPQASASYPTTYPTTYPPATTATPYAQNTGSTFLAPTRKGVRGRRVLNVALLSCPVSGTSARVLAIGKFFMTVPATTDHLWAEFAGVALEESLGTQMELYP
jgi:hypothetical protein